MSGEVADATLLERFRAGDRLAGAELLERHFDALYGFLRRRAIGAVDDLVQQTFLACLEGRAQFRGESSFRTYLLQIARYQLYAHYRRMSRTSDADPLAAAARETTTTARMVRAQDERLVLQALRSLPPKFQVVLKLSYFDGLSGPEIGRVLSIPEPTVRSRLRRALDHLREATADLARDGAQLRETSSELCSWAERVGQSLVMSA